MNITPFTQATLLLTSQTLVRGANLRALTSSERAPRLSLSSSCVQWGRDLKEGRLRGKWLPHTNICLDGGLYQTVGFIPCLFSSHINTSRGVFHRSAPGELAQFHAVINEHCSSSSVFNVQWHQWTQAYDRTHQHCISDINLQKKNQFKQKLECWAIKSYGLVLIHNISKAFSLKYGTNKNVSWRMYMSLKSKRGRKRSQHFNIYQLFSQSLSSSVVAS